MANEQVIRSTSPPNLVVPRAEAEQKIQARIEKGREIRTLPIANQEDLERAQAEHVKWVEYNVALLARLFDDKSITERYELRPGVFSHPCSLADFANDFRKDVEVLLV